MLLRHHVNKQIIELNCFESRTLIFLFIIVNFDLKIPVIVL
jgi:hypothetical protein